MAAGRELTASFRLRFIDGISSSLTRLQQRFERLTSVMRRIGAIGAIAGGLTFAGPVQGAAAFETQLRDIGVTAGHTGAALDAAVARMRGRVQGLALAWRESSQDLAGGLGVLLARGIDADRANAYLDILAEVRAASGAATDSLAQLAVGFERIAKIEGPERMREAMAVALRGGQLGGVELRDMARYLPGTLAQMDGLGVSGLRAVQNSVAMFQVLRDGFGTVEETAAGAQELIGHLLSDSTVRRAAEFGVDLRGVWRSAGEQMRRGVDIDPFEALIQALRPIIAADPARVFELMPDRNSRQALLTFIAQVPRYLDLRRQLRAATPETITQAASDRMRGLGADMRKFNEELGQLGDRIGRAFGANLPTALELLGGLRSGLAWLDQNYPGLVDATIGWGGSLAIAAGALGLMVPVLGVIATGLGLLFSPGGLIAAAAAGAVLLWRNWERIGPRMRALWEGVKATFRDWVAWVRGWVSGAVDRAIGLLRGTWWVLTTWFNTLWKAVGSAFDAFVEWVDRWTGGAATTAIEGIKRAWGALTAWFSELWDGITDRFQRFIDRTLELVNEAKRRLEGTGKGRLTDPAEQQRRNRNFNERGLLENYPRPEGIPPPAVLRRGAAAAGEGGPGDWRGHIEVRVTGPGEVTATRSSTPAVTIDRGRTLGRP